MNHQRFLHLFFPHTLSFLHRCWMWLLVPVCGTPSPLARTAGISALPAGYRGLWHVSSPASEPHTPLRGTQTIYLEEWTALEVSNSQISLRKLQAFSLPLV